MLQQGPGSVGEEQGEVADDEVGVVRSSQLAGRPVVRKPQLRPCFPRVLGDGSRGPEPVGNGARRMAWLKACGPGGSGEGLRSSSLSSRPPHLGW
jgi:hypothetical protein